MLIERVEPDHSPAAERSDHPAVVFEGEEISYSSLHEGVRNRARWLLGRGVGRGERVALLAPNEPAFIETLLACARIGAILVPLNTRLTAEEIAYQVDHCSPVIGLTGGELGTLLDEAAPELPGADLDDAWQATGRSEATGSVGDDDPALIVYTSGTTGRPRGVIHTHKSLDATIRNGVAAHDLTPDDVGLTFLPLFHVGGLNIQTLPLLSVGATVLLHRSFDPERVLHTIEADQPTISLVVPAVMRALVDHPRWGETDFSSLRGVMAGSSIVPTELLQAFIDVGVPAGQVYGSTETGPTAVVLRFEDAHRVGCCGRAAAESDYRVVDSDGQPAERGEVQVKGPNVFTGYWRDTEETAAAFDGPWHRTGDVGEVEDGWLTVRDRIGDLIISGGENIYPAELEAVLADAPGVDELTVIGLPDERWGQTPVAVATASPGSTPTLQSIRAHGEGHLARFKLPTRLEVVERLPRTALGKVQKHELVELLSSVG